MATFQGNWAGNNNGYRSAIKLTITEDNIDTVNNTSKITWTVSKVNENNSYNTYGYAGAVYINGGDAKWSRSDYPYDASNAGDRKSDSFTITHNSDGTKSFAVSGYWYFTDTSSTTNPSLYKSSFSGTFTCSTIARASTISSAPASSIKITNSNGSTNLSVTVAPKASFYHRVDWYIGSTRIARTDKTTATSSSFSCTVPYSTIATNCTSASTCTVTCYVYTYSGSTLASSTQVGSTQSASTSVTISATPTISNFTKTYAYCGLTNSWQTTVSGTGNGIYGSTVSYKYTCSNTNVTVGSATSSSSTFTAKNTGTKYTFTVTLKVTDSRGNSTSSTTSAIIVSGYTPITMSNLKTQRCNADGTINSVGVYSKFTYGSLNYSYDGSDSPSFNTMITSAVYTVGSSTVSTSANTVSTDTLAINETRQYTIIVSDGYTSVTYSSVVQTATYALDLYDDGSGNVGVGLGTMAQSGKVTTGLPLEVTGNLKTDGNLTVGGSTITVNSKSIPYVTEMGTAGKWTYKLWSNGYLEQWYRQSYGTISITSTWGNLYSGGWISPITYGKPFKTTPVCVASIEVSSSTNGNAFLATAFEKGISSATQTPAWQLLRGTSGSSNGYLSIFAFGIAA